MTEKPAPEPSSFVVKGGHVQIGAFALGPGARASYRQEMPRAELLALFQELYETVQRLEAGLADAAAVRQAVEDVHAELERKRPDRSRLRQQLDKIATAAGPAVEIAAAAATLARAIAGA